MIDPRLLAPTKKNIVKASESLLSGNLVAFPTETVYGLGADATNERAVSRIYSVKGRPTDHPLIVHISSLNKLEDWARDIPDYAIELAREFWPGPMTLILPKKDIAKKFITGGQNNVGLRVPNQRIALALLRKFEEMGGQGIAAPSANRFGAVSPTTAGAVIEELGSFFARDDSVLDGSACQIGLESTIIDCTGIAPIVLRPGAITSVMIELILGKMPPTNESVIFTKAPGMLRVHYSPKAQVRLNIKPISGDGFIALNSVFTPKGVIRIASPENLTEFARVLYKSLREADRLKLTRIIVHLPEEQGLGIAIRDRLEKASGN